MSNIKRSILGSGRMTKNYRYEVNGRIIIDTVDLDTANGNFGNITDTVELVTGFGGLITKPKPIDPNSELAKAVAEDKTGDRNDTYQKVMVNVKKNAAEQGNLALYNEALNQSGMSDVANGTAQLDAPVISTQEVDNTVKEETSDDVQPKEKKRSNASIDYYKYPKDMHLDQDYMYIEKFEYKPPQAAYLSENVLTGQRYRSPIHREGMMGWLPGANGALGPLDPDFWRALTGKHEIVNEYETRQGQNPMSVINDGLGKGSNLGADKKLMGSVKLPIPNGLSVSQGVNWGEGRVNALEAGAFLGVQNEMSQLIAGKKNLAGVFGAGVQGMMDGLAQLKQVGTGGSNQILSSLLAKNTLAQLGINVDSSQMIARSTGTAINPNLELLFSGPKLRTFQFVFNFAPNEADEAQEVRGIMRMFREGMLPHNASTGDKLFLGAPDVFRLSYKNKTKRIKSLNIFKICALTACEINFTPDNQYQSYEDAAAVSMPVRSTMKLTFTELSPIFADDYVGQGGASVDDLGTLVTGENEITDNDIGF